MEFAKTLLLLFVSSALLLAPARASDPDRLQDFCVADNSSGITVNGFPCRPASAVTVKDFVFDGLVKEGNTSATPFGSAVTSANVLTFPALNTLGVSMNRVDFAPGGLNPPHSHPRATELLLVLEGRLLVGFVTTGNELFTTVVGAGENFVAPKGLVHFQLNVGKGTAKAVTAFDSQLPGAVVASLSLFGTTPEIPDEVLEKALQLDKEAVRMIKAKAFSQSPLPSPAHHVLLLLLLPWSSTPLLPPPPPSHRPAIAPHRRRRRCCRRGPVQRHHHIRPPPPVRPAARHPPRHREVLLRRLQWPIRRGALRPLLRRLRVRHLLRDPRHRPPQLRRHLRPRGRPDPQLLHLVRRQRRHGGSPFLRVRLPPVRMGHPQAQHRPVPDHSLLQGEPLAVPARQEGRPLHVRDHFCTSSLTELYEGKEAYRKIHGRTEAGEASRTRVRLAYSKSLI